MTTEYNKGVLEGLNIAKDITYWCDNVGEVKLSILEKIRIWKKIMKDYEAIHNNKIG